MREVHVRCQICGKFMSWWMKTVYVPEWEYNPYATDPPEPRPAHKKCADA